MNMYQPAGEANETPEDKTGFKPLCLCCHEELKSNEPVICSNCCTSCFPVLPPVVQTMGHAFSH